MPVKKIVFQQCLQYLCCKQEVKRRKISFKWNSILLKNHAHVVAKMKKAILFNSPIILNIAF